MSFHLAGFATGSRRGGLSFLSAAASGGTVVLSWVPCRLIFPSPERQAGHRELGRP